MKRFIPSFVFISIGAILVIAYWTIGSSVSPNGQVIEPFFLTAIGAILIATGVVIGVIVGFIAIIKQIMKKVKNNSNS